MKSWMQLLIPVFAFLLIAGCGSGEPTVVMPTETYQPTETEQANAERDDADREAENR